MKFKQKALVALMAMSAATAAFATATGGYAGDVTGGGSTTPVTVSTLADFQSVIAAYGKAYKAGTATSLVVIYNGNEDALIKAASLDPCGQHSKAVREVDIKAMSNITVLGADGSSANFGIRIGKGATNIIVRNMTFGYIPGGSSNGDAMGVEGTSNVWIDHNEFFDANVDSVFPTFVPDGVTAPKQVWCPGTSGNDTAYDGLVDMKNGTTNVTFSYNYVHDHHKVGLDGSSDSDLDGNITFHHNYYYNVGARLPLQRGGLTHEYSNYYDTVTTSGINVRMGGQALIESNWIQNALNIVTSRDSKTIGYWDLRNNNVASTGDFGTYNITWDVPSSTPYKNADDWATTKVFPGVSYSYTADSPTCVKNNLLAVAGAGKGLKSISCSGSSSSAASSKSASSAAASSAASSKASSSAASSAAASSAASSKASSSAASSASGAPTLSGTGDYPTGFSKCADLGGTCAVPSSATGWVAFGRKGSWVVKNVGAGKSIACTVAAFGSEPNGNPDKCSYQK